MLAMGDFGLAMNLHSLPYPGSLQDQPHSVVLYFRILNGAYGEANEEEMKAAESK